MIRRPCLGGDPARGPRASFRPSRPRPGPARRKPTTPAVEPLEGRVLLTVRLWAEDSHATETASVPASFTVTRDGDVGEDLVVGYRLEGTAVDGEDYQALPGRVTIPAGSRSASIRIEPRDDADVEGNETVKLVLTEAPGHALGAPSSITAIATIYDDDQLGPGQSALPDDVIGRFALDGGQYATWRRSVPVTGMPFAQATEVTVPARPPLIWSVQARVGNAAPVQPGDALVLVFYARSTGEGPGRVNVVFERAGTPFTKSLDTTIEVGQDWTPTVVGFTAAEAYAANGAQLNFRVGFDPQTLQIGGVALVNHGQVPASTLPRAPVSYQGREAAAAWREEAARRIEAYRKADLAVAVLDAAGNPVEGAQVSARLTRHAFGFGSAVAADGINNPHPVDGGNYRSLIVQRFNKVVLENDLKWPGWRANRRRATDAIAWLRNFGITDIRGHNLIWPAWRHIPSTTGGSGSYRGIPFTNSQTEYNAHVAADGPEVAAAWLRDRILDHIADEAGSPGVAGLLTDWDVINEPYAHRDIMNILGDDEMIAWFQAAKAADPNARMFLNDYPNPGSRGAHLDSFERTIRSLIDGGAPLEGIGFQGHFTGGNLAGMDATLATYDRFAAFGRALQITEFDVSDKDEQLQADYLRDFMTLAFSHPAMDAFVMWGFWEGRHWRPDAALWRRDWSIKPNGQQWEDLVFYEWATNVTGLTAPDGQYQARGFLGEYEITVRFGDQIHVINATLAPDGSGVTVVLDPTEPPVEGAVMSRAGAGDWIMVPVGPDGIAPTNSLPTGTGDAVAGGPLPARPGLDHFLARRRAAAPWSIRREGPWASGKA